MSHDVHIPKVSGQHRNKALSAERRRQAVEMILLGRSYQDVADELGYANRGTVHRIVQEALADNEAENIEELRQLELDRLDALQYAQWDAAIAGDADAATVILKIMDRRARILGLFSNPHTSRPDDADVTVLW